MNDKKGQLIGLERPSKRKQLALERSRGGRGGFAGRPDWQLEQWGVRGHAVPLPFTVQAGGSRESCPRSWQPQVGFVVCHHGSCSTNLPLSALSDTQTHASLLSVCVHIFQYVYVHVCIFTSEMKSATLGSSIYKKYFFVSHRF